MQLFDGSPAQYPAWFHPTPTPDGGFKAFASEGGLKSGSLPIQTATESERIGLPNREVPATLRGLPFSE